MFFSNLLFFTYNRVNDFNIRYEAKPLIDKKLVKNVNCSFVDININELTDEQILNNPISTLNLSPSTVSVVNPDLREFNEPFNKFGIEKIDMLLKDKPDYKEIFNTFKKEKNLKLAFALNKYHIVYPLFKCKEYLYLVVNALPNSLKSLEHIDEENYKNIKIKLSTDVFLKTLIIAKYNYYTEEIYNKVKYNLDYLIMHKKIFDRVLFERENIVLEDKVYKKALITYLLSPSVSTSKIDAKRIKKLMDINEEPLKYKTWSAIIHYIHQNGYKYDILTVKSFLYKNNYYLPILLSSIKGIISIYAGTKYKIPMFNSKLLKDIILSFNFDKYI